MSTTTTNLGLIKPELTDAADITAMNENWDKLDQVIKENKDEAKAYADEKIASIPTPDVSGQIGDHNTDGTAHSDIRQLISDVQTIAEGALPIEGGTITGTELGINNNRGKLVANGNMFRVYATEDPSDTSNQRYLNFYSQYFKEDVSESLKLTERIDGVDHAYKIYGEHNITSGTTDLTAGTSELPSGHIYFVYE